MSKYLKICFIVFLASCSPVKKVETNNFDNSTLSVFKLNSILAEAGNINISGGCLSGFSYNKCNSKFSHPTDNNLLFSCKEQNYDRYKVMLDRIRSGEITAEETAQIWGLDEEGSFSESQEDCSKYKENNNLVDYNVDYKINNNIIIGFSMIASKSNQSANYKNAALIYQFFCNKNPVGISKEKILSMIDSVDFDSC